MGPASRWWLPSQDSNLDAKLQRLLCYRYTTRQGSRVDDSSIAAAGSGAAPEGDLTRLVRSRQLLPVLRERQRARVRRGQRADFATGPYVEQPDVLLGADGDGAVVLRQRQGANLPFTADNKPLMPTRHY